MNKMTSLLKWYDTNKEPHPWRLHWEAHKDPYVIWLSEIMLQQTTIAAMTPVFLKFMSRFPSIEATSNANVQELKQQVKGLGYYRRFDLFHKACQKLNKKKPIVWPNSYCSWIQLPGIGEYTASILSSIVNNQPEACVDGNVVRVFSRVHGIYDHTYDNKLKSYIKELASKQIVKTRPGDFNQAIMELGQKICRPLSPACAKCPLQKNCIAYKNNKQHLAPQKIRQPKQNVFVQLAIIRNQSKFLLVPRDESSMVLKKILGFRTKIYKSDKPDKRPLIGKFSHSITKYKINTSVYFEKNANVKNNLNHLWLPKDKVFENLISSLDQKAWNLFSKK